MIQSLVFMRPFVLMAAPQSRPHNDDLLGMTPVEVHASVAATAWQIREASFDRNSRLSGAWNGITWNHPDIETMKKYPERTRVQSHVVSSSGQFSSLVQQQSVKDSSPPGTVALPFLLSSVNTCVRRGNTVFVNSERALDIKKTSTKTFEDRVHILVQGQPMTKN